MKKYGIILIGCGHIGLEHLMDIYYRDNINVVAAVDTNINAAKEAAKRCGTAEFSDDYKKYLTDSRIDIAIVATYTESHVDITSDFLNAGKHVLCEKPIANSLEGGRKFYETAIASKQKVLVAHILRHNRSYNKIKELIDSGAIGELKVFRMVQNQHSVNWDRFKCLLSDCTPALDCGVHYYDVARWFTGSEFKSISGFGTKIEADAPNLNYNFINFTLENGCVGYYEVGWSKSIGAQNTKEFIGTKGRISLVMEAFRPTEKEEGDLISVYHSDTGVYETVNCKSEYKDMYSQLSTLIGMIEGRSNGNPTLKDALIAHEIASAAQYAVLTGKEVRFEEGRVSGDWGKS